MVEVIHITHKYNNALHNEENHHQHTSLFRRALSVNISANDIFGWNQWASASANPFLPSDKTTVPQSRYVSFGLTLRLGQMELEREPRNLRKKE